MSGHISVVGARDFDVRARDWVVRSYASNSKLMSMLLFINIYIVLLVLRDEKNETDERHELKTSNRVKWRIYNAFKLWAN